MAGGYCIVSGSCPTWIYVFFGCIVASVEEGEVGRALGRRATVVGAHHGSGLKEWCTV